MVRRPHLQCGERQFDSKLTLTTLTTLPPARPDQYSSPVRTYQVPKKMCELCREKPATVPDRSQVGRPINRVCSSCHALRLSGDMKRIFDLQQKRQMK